jgi:hypothetical protein
LALVLMVFSKFQYRPAALSDNEGTDNSR